MTMFSSILAGGSAGAGLMGNKYSQEMQDDLNEFNKKISESQAVDALDRGRQEENRFRGETNRVIGSQRAAMGAQGISLEDGTALDVQADTQRSGEIDALTIRNNAAREAWGYRTEGVNLGLRGIMSSYASQQQQRATILEGGSRISAANSRRRTNNNRSPETVEYDP